MTPPAFSMRVYYEDTDSGGIVYYANYLKFLERARTEALRAIGIEQSALTREHGVSFVVRHCAVDFLKPAMLDDYLTIETRLNDIHRVSMDMQQTIRRDATLLVSAQVKIAIIGPGLKPVRLPQTVRDALTALINNTMSDEEDERCVK